MKLKSFVKVGNISNLSDARYCAGFGVNLLGFNLDASQEDAISWEMAKEIIGWVSVEGIVLECGSMSVDAILNIVKQDIADYYQIDNVETTQQLASQDISIIYRAIISDSSQLNTLSEDLQSLPENVKYLVIECSESEFMNDAEQVLTRVSTSCPVLKGYALEASSVLDSISGPIYDGIALKGSQEEKAGFKDYDELADILEELEIES